MRRLNPIVFTASMVAILCVSEFSRAADDASTNTNDRAPASTEMSGDRSPASASPATRDPAGVRRRPQQDDGGPIVPDSYYGDPPKKQAKDKSLYGIRVDVYYDGVSQYDKLYSTNYGVGQFANQTATGISGMEFLLQTVVHRWEFSTGLDYAFPINAQGQQGANAFYVVNNQTLNIMGLKALQVGYHFDGGQFSIVPYGGIGIYYGKNVVNLSNYATATPAGGQDTVTYTKILANFLAGVRLEYDFSKQAPIFSAGITIEAFVPTKLSDSLAQTGTTGTVGNGTGTSEIPGYETNLQNNMDFMTNFGARLMANVSVYF